MNHQPTLFDGQFFIRPLTEQDIPALAEAANDPLIWEQHPAKDRADKTLFTAYAKLLISKGGAMVFIKQDEDRIIGCSRFYAAPNDEAAWSIGFTFIQREFWGKGVNLALKTLMINHIFKTDDTVWLHIDPDNVRSQRATEKLGARKVLEIDADVLQTGIMAPYFCYRLNRNDWTG